MRTVFLIGALGIVSACSAGNVGGGNYNGVPLDEGGTTTCTTAGGVITSSNESVREDLIRCGPQSQPLAGS